MKRHICFSCLLIACLLLASCNRSTPSASSTQPAAGGAKAQIAVIPKGTTHEFWKSIHAGAIKAGNELGVEIIWKGPLREDDREEQIKVVEDFVDRHVGAIVLAPLDDQALVPSVAHAAASKIPVVIIDSDLKSNDYASFCATDNFKGGQTAGDELVRLLGGKGKVVMLRYQPGSASTTNRENGFLDAIKKNPGIEMVVDNQFGGATAESAQQKSENILAPLKKADGTLAADGIFCCNESTTFGMLRALEDAKLAGKVKFVGFDASSKLVDALSAGEVDALVVQNPMNMGYIGVSMAVKAMRGEPVEKHIDTGAKLVTKANMDQADMKDLLHPPLDKYLK